MKYTYDELAGMIDHSLLHPTLTDQELEEGCRLAAKYPCRFGMCEAVFRQARR